MNELYLGGREEVAFDLSYLDSYGKRNNTFRPCSVPAKRTGTGTVARWGTA